MDLSRKLGRHVERFKQSAQEAADDGADYRCRSCEAGFVTDYAECPDCGAEAVEPVADDGEANGGESADGEGEDAASRDAPDAAE